MTQAELLAIAAVSAAVLACLISFVCLYRLGSQKVKFDLLLAAVTTKHGMSLAARLDAMDERAEDISDRNRAALASMDQGLRDTLAAGTRDGLVTAFDKVQEGTLAQATALGAFTTFMQDAIGGIATRIEIQADRVNSTTDRLHAAIAEKLAEAGVAAVQARADMIRDLSLAIAKAHEATEAALHTFGETQGKGLAAIGTALTEAEVAAVMARGDLLKELSGTVTASREQTEAALRLFGEEQGRRLDAIAEASRAGAATSVKEFSDFRSQVAERLEAVKEAVTLTLGKSVETLGGITTAMAIAQGATERTLAEQRQAVLKELADGMKAVNLRLAEDLGQVAERLRLGFDGFAAGSREEQERLRVLVGGKLDEMRTGNEAKLEVIRQTVDEQLQSALEKRVGESFQRVADQLTQMMQGIGQVQAVAGEVGDLKRLFSNVKVRGGWGESQIRHVLEDMLPPGAYATNMSIGDGGEVVEFALRMPTNDPDRTVWLAIDAKFPTEDYDHLLLAAERGDREAEADARKAMGTRIRNEAKRIESKYVKPPLTVEYGVLFLPTEGLFAEVNRIPALIEDVRRNHHVWIVGPALLPALLHCIRVGHLTLALEQKAGAIGETLGAVKAAWEDLVKSLDLSLTRVNGLKTQLTKTQTKARTVGKALKTVAVMEFQQAEVLLGLESEAVAVAIEEMELSDEDGVGEDQAVAAE